VVVIIRGKRPGARSHRRPARTGAPRRGCASAHVHELLRTSLRLVMEARERATSRPTWRKRDPSGGSPQNAERKRKRAARAPTGCTPLELGACGWGGTERVDGRGLKAVNVGCGRGGVPGLVTFQWVVSAVGAAVSLTRWPLWLR